jgi:hypothetical protein
MKLNAKEILVIVRERIDFSVCLEILEMKISATNDFT